MTAPTNPTENQTTSRLLSYANYLILLSCDKKTFEAAAPTYNDALTRSNFNTQLKYEQPDLNARTQHKRQRNVMWYNSHYSKNVKTNIAREFLQLIDKHFPPNNKLHKLFNRHTIRVSYSCSENMKTFINRHNKTILKKHNQQTKPTSTNDSRLCNCRNQKQCPIQGHCLQANVVYKAEVTTTDNNETKTYIGVTATEFKTRFRNRTKSLNRKKYRNETELSKYIWRLKDSKRSHKIKWEIIKQIPSCKNRREEMRFMP